MRTKSKNLFDFSSQYDYDIFVIIESWLNKDFFDAEYFNLNFYNVYRKDRSAEKTGHSKGGGVLVAVKKEFKSHICSKVVVDDLLDQLFVVIPAANGILYLCVSYVPPTSPPDLYAAHVNNILSLHENMVANARVFILGDFNLPNIVWSNFNDFLLPSNINKDYEINLIDSCFDMGLVQINNIYNGLNRILDLLFVSPEAKYFIYECLQPFSPANIHHKAIVVELEYYNYLRCSNDLSEKQFNFNICDFDALNSILHNINWQNVLNSDSINNSYELFLNTFLNVCNENIPFKKDKCSTSHPWYTKGLKKLKNRRNKLHRSFVATGCVETEQRYFLCQKEFNFLNKFLYKQYLLKIENDIKSNPKSFWTFIRSKTGKTVIPSSMVFGNLSSDKSDDIVNLFADYFKSNFNDMIINPASNPTFSGNSYNSSNINLGLILLSQEDIIQSINDVRNSFRADSDGLSAFLLKKCSESISFPLMIIFNNSLSKGIFADRWKHTFITPVFKSGRKEDVTCYRSISKLSVVSKIFEHAIYNKLYFATKSIIIPQQHGFRCGRSTISNLMVFTDYCISQFEARLQVDAVYTDMSKAFDKLSHEILLHKLRCLGIHSSFLNWFSSYLHNRTCIVKIEKHESLPYIQTSGVPQGSILGPLLFNIFINDIFLCFKHSKFLLYADDLKIFSKISCLNDVTKLQKDLNELNKWCANNNLNFNMSKCFHVSYFRIRNPIQTSYSIGGNSVKTVNEVDDLGIVFDSKFTFLPHLEKLIPKCYSSLAFIRRNCNDFSDPYTLKFLYTSYVRSKLEYGAMIWSPYTNEHISRIEKIQRRFIKFALPHLSNVEPLPSYEVCCMHLGMETLEDRRKIQSMLFVFDLVNGNIDCSDLLEKIPFNVPHRSLRHNEIFYEAFHRFNYILNSPLTRTFKYFNLLNLRHLVEFNISKSDFKNILLFNLSKLK